MDCSSTVAKYLVFIFNFLFFLAGVALIVIGSLAITNHQDVYEKIIPNSNNLSGAAVVFIVVGSIVTVISFFGCCGAIKESSCMLNTFAIFLVLIVLAQIAIAVAAFVLRSKFKDVLTDSIAKYPSDTADIKWDELQKNLTCCGVDGPSDWHSNPLYQSTILPPSCCGKMALACTDGSSNLIHTGCYQVLDVYYIAIGAVGLVLGLIEIMGIIFACCLSRSVKS
jgi:CD63 antigen